MRGATYMLTAWALLGLCAHVAAVQKYEGCKGSSFKLSGFASPQLNDQWWAQHPNRTVGGKPTYHQTVHYAVDGWKDTGMHYIFWCTQGAGMWAIGGGDAATRAINFNGGECQTEALKATSGDIFEADSQWVDTSSSLEGERRDVNLSACGIQINMCGGDCDGKGFAFPFDTCVQMQTCDGPSRGHYIKVITTKEDQEETGWTTVTAHSYRDPFCSHYISGNTVHSKQYKCDVCTNSTGEVLPPGTTFPCYAVASLEPEVTSSGIPGVAVAAVVFCIAAAVLAYLGFLYFTKNQRAQARGGRSGDVEMQGGELPLLDDRPPQPAGGGHPGETPPNGRDRRSSTPLTTVTPDYVGEVEDALRESERNRQVRENHVPLKIPTPRESYAAPPLTAQAGGMLPSPLAASSAKPQAEQQQPVPESQPLAGSMRSKKKKGRSVSSLNRSQDGAWDGDDAAALSLPKAAAARQEKPSDPSPAPDSWEKTNPPAPAPQQDEWDDAAAGPIISAARAPPSPSGGDAKKKEKAEKKDKAEKKKGKKAKDKTPPPAAKPQEEEWGGEGGDAPLAVPPPREAEEEWGGEDSAALPQPAAVKGGGAEEEWDEGGGGDAPLPTAAKPQPAGLDEEAWEEGEDATLPQPGAAKSKAAAPPTPPDAAGDEQWDDGGGDALSKPPAKAEAKPAKDEWDDASTPAPLPAPPAAAAAAAPDAGGSEWDEGDEGAAPLPTAAPLRQGGKPEKEKEKKENAGEDWDEGDSTALPQSQKKAEKPPAVEDEGKGDGEWDDADAPPVAAAQKKAEPETGGGGDDWEEDDTPVPKKAQPKQKEDDGGDDWGGADDTPISKPPAKAAKEAKAAPPNSDEQWEEDDSAPAPPRKLPPKNTPSGEDEDGWDDAAAAAAPVPAVVPAAGKKKAEEEDWEDEEAPKAKETKPAAAAAAAEDEDWGDDTPAPKKKPAKPAADDEDWGDDTPAPKKKPAADDEDWGDAPAAKPKKSKAKPEEEDWGDDTPAPKKKPVKHLPDQDEDWGAEERPVLRKVGLPGQRANAADDEGWGDADAGAAKPKKAAKAEEEDWEDEAPKAKAKKPAADDEDWGDDTPAPKKKPAADDEDWGDAPAAKPKKTKAKPEEEDWGDDTPAPKKKPVKHLTQQDEDWGAEERPVLRKVGLPGQRADADDEGWGDAGGNSKGKADEEDGWGEADAGAKPKKAAKAEEEDWEDEAPKAKAKKPAADDEDWGDDTPAPKKKPAKPAADDEDWGDDAPAKPKKAKAEDEDWGDDTPAPKKKPAPVEEEAAWDDEGVDWGDDEDDAEDGWDEAPAPAAPAAPAPAPEASKKPDAPKHAAHVPASLDITIKTVEGADIPDCDRPSVAVAVALKNCPSQKARKTRMTSQSGGVYQWDQRLKVTIPDGKLPITLLTKVTAQRETVAQAPLLLTQDMFHAGNDYTHTVKLEPKGALVLEAAPVYSQKATADEGMDDELASILQRRRLQTDY